MVNGDEANPAVLWRCGHRRRLQQSLYKRCAILFLGLFFAATRTLAFKFYANLRHRRTLLAPKEKRLPFVFTEPFCQDDGTYFNAELAARLEHFERVTRPPNSCLHLAPLSLSNHNNESNYLHRFCEVNPTEMQQYCCKTTENVCGDFEDFMPLTQSRVAQEESSLENQATRTVPQFPKEPLLLRAARSLQETSNVLRYHKLFETSTVTPVLALGEQVSAREAQTVAMGNQLSMTVPEVILAVQKLFSNTQTTNELPVNWFQTENNYQFEVLPITKRLNAVLWCARK